MSQYGCKICRVLEERGMERYENRLVEQWSADRGQRKGYRQLATWLNVLMLRREMDRAGLSTLGDEAASKYKRLTGDDGTVVAEVRDVLRNSGIDVDALENDFVSYGVIRTHLIDCLGEEHETESTDWEPEAIEIARSNAEKKAREAVHTLVNKAKLDVGGDVRVSASIELECDECHTRVPAERAIRRGYVCEGCVLLQ
jgi:hypothetical protein